MYYVYLLPTQSNSDDASFLLQSGAQLGRPDPVLVSVDKAFSSSRPVALGQHLQLAESVPDVLQLLPGVGVSPYLLGDLAANGAGELGCGAGEATAGDLAQAAHGHGRVGQLLGEVNLHLPKTKFQDNLNYVHDVVTHLEPQLISNHLLPLPPRASLNTSCLLVST